jgi:hypothetical protein
MLSINYLYDRYPLKHQNLKGKDQTFTQKLKTIQVSFLFYHFKLFSFI